MPTLVSVNVAAKRLGIHASTLRLWVQRGRIPAYRMGRRFVRLDLDAVLARLATDEVEPAGGGKDSRPAQVASR